MALRGKKPELKDKRMKALFFGAAGVGKTTAAIQFPKPYLIDTERGAENEGYAKILTDRGGVLFQTSDFDEMIAEVKALLSEDHEYRTLIIDPITTVYDDLLDKAANKVGTDFGRHYGEAKKQWKQLYNLLNRLDMNVIITSHAKKLYGENLSVLGNTFDGPKGLDYLFDLVFEIQRRGEKRVARVEKTRMGTFPENDVFPFSYDEVAERYGRDVLEREAVAVTLASEEMASQIRLLITEVGVLTETQDKWLDKAKASDWTEVSEEQATKILAHLEAQIAAKKAGVA
jgi:predicted ATP-dependent serine protease